MKEVTILRKQSQDWGTLGMLTIEGEKFQCLTLELPWKLNTKKTSCITPGSYLCQLIDTPKFGKVYTVQNVDKRDGILIHAGNWAGDVGKNMRTDSHGCILLGRKLIMMEGQYGINETRQVLKEFHDIMNGENFGLTIKTV